MCRCIRRSRPGRKLGVFQYWIMRSYSQTTEYVERFSLLIPISLIFIIVVFLLKSRHVHLCFNNIGDLGARSAGISGFERCPIHVSGRKTLTSSRRTCGIMIFRICSLFGCINGKWAGVYVALLVSVPKRVLIGGGPY